MKCDIKNCSLFKFLQIIKDGKRAPGGQWARNKRTARAKRFHFFGQLPGAAHFYKKEFGSISNDHFTFNFQYNKKRFF